MSAFCLGLGLFLHLKLYLCASMCVRECDDDEKKIQKSNKAETPGEAQGKGACHGFKT